MPSFIWSHVTILLNLQDLRKSFPLYFYHKNGGNLQPLSSQHVHAVRFTPIMFDRHMHKQQFVQFMQIRFYLLTLPNTSGIEGAVPVMQTRWDSVVLSSPRVVSARPGLQDPDSRESCSFRSLLVIFRWNGVQRLPFSSSLQLNSGL